MDGCRDIVRAHSGAVLSSASNTLFFSLSGGGRRRRDLLSISGGGKRERPVDRVRVASTCTRCSAGRGKQKRNSKSMHTQLGDGKKTSTSRVHAVAVARPSAVGGMGAMDGGLARRKVCAARTVQSCRERERERGPRERGRTVTAGDRARSVGWWSAGREGRSRS